ncbi:MAG: hypothetical protein WCH32_02620 [Pseudomonadota bacterium]
MRTPTALHLDFVAGPHQSPLLGGTLCAIGLAAAIAVGLMFDAQVNVRNHLDAELNGVMSSRTPKLPTAVHSEQDAAKIEAELSVPWSQLLSELEIAGQDSESTVSLLQVEPDPAKHTVRITAEARSLPAALAYLQRLQKSKVLRYPMLESHELKKDDPEHPVRVKLAAEWRT